jgi:hypothetical protein
MAEFTLGWSAAMDRALKKFEALEHLHNVNQDKAILVALLMIETRLEQIAHILDEK